MREWNSELVTLEQESVNINHQHNSISKTTCYNNICQTYQSNKEDSEWYLKSSRKNLHKTQVKRSVNSLYSKSDSEESYEVIKSFFTKKKPLQNKFNYAQQENHYSSDSSQEDFLQEELQEIRDIIKIINN